eukprot:s2070_g11.t1
MGGFGPMMKAIERKATFALESGQDSNSAEAQSAGFPAQCASIIAWSCATLSALASVRDEGMFGILAELAGPRLRELKPYEVTNLIWAFAKLAVPCVQLYQNAAKMLQTRRHGEYKAQCLSAAVWTAQIQLFKSIGDEMAPQVASLKPQEMANTVWSFGRVRVKHQRLFEEICGTFANNPGASRFSIPQLTSILMGCAQVRFQQPEVIGRISAVMLRNSHALTAEQMSCVLWSLAELDAHDRDMAAADLTAFKHEELVSKPCAHSTVSFLTPTKRYLERIEVEMGCTCSAYWRNRRKNELDARGCQWFRSSLSSVSVAKPGQADLKVAYKPLQHPVWWGQAALPAEIDRPTYEDLGNYYPPQRTTIAGKE